MTTLTTSVSDDTTTPARPPRSRLSRIGKRSAQVLVVLTALALFGATVQAVAERRDAAAHPAEGELVTLPDGRLLHLVVAGERKTGPTVILEGGAGASTVAWSWIIPALAEHATVVAYDRAGLGWSDPAPHEPSVEPVLTDLQDALAARSLPGPYILVGHSLGGHYVRAFADAHPDQVTGVVLVDPSHERGAEVVGMTSGQMWPMTLALRVAARTGLLRLYNPFDADLHTLPQPQRDQALAQHVSTGYARTFGAEMLALDRIGSELPGRPGALGDIPLRLVIATGGATNAEQQTAIDEMADLRRGLAALSSDTRTSIVPDASHVSLVTDPEHARIVSDAVIDLLG